MLRTAPRVQKNYFQEENALQQNRQSSIKPSRKIPSVPSFPKGSGYRLGHAEEPLPQEESKWDHKRVVDRPVKYAKLKTPEEEIQFLLSNMVSVLPLMSSFTQKELLSWCRQFVEYKKMDLNKRAFFLGYLIVNILNPILDPDPDLQDLEITNEEKFCAKKWRDSSNSLLKAYLNIDIEKYLERIAEGLNAEMEFREQNERLDRETQAKIDALNQAVQAENDHMDAVFARVKREVLFSHQNSQAKVNAIDEQMDLLKQQVNESAGNLLEHTSLMDRLGEQDDKISSKIAECCDLLQKLGEK